MPVINKIKIGHSPLTDRIFIYRHGKNPRIALEKREAEADVMCALVAHMMHNAPKGSEKIILIGQNKYTVRVTPIDDSSEMLQAEGK